MEIVENKREVTTAETRVYVYNGGWPADNDPDEVLRFVYDSGPLTLRVSHGETSGWASPTASSQGWNVVMVLDGLDDNDIVRKYTWGLDLSGQRGNSTASGIHGAGGIGGLLALDTPGNANAFGQGPAGLARPASQGLAVEETGTSGSPKYWFLYDANGNVGQLVQNTTNYPLTVQYEYDAYGKVLSHRQPIPL